MNNQEALNRAAEHMLVKQRQAAYYDGACRYWTREGTMCAIGCLLDEQTAYNLEAQGFGTITGVMFSGRSDATPNEYSRAAGQAVIQLGETTMQFLDSLQQAHDGPAAKADNPLQWRSLVRKKLRYLAEEYGLELPACVDGSEP